MVQQQQWQQAEFVTDRVMTDSVMQARCPQLTFTTLLLASG